MASRTARANNSGTAFEADTKNIITSADDLGELTPERRDQYLKRIKKQDKADAKNFKKVSHYIVIEGKKVLRKLKNAAGSEYTFYWFNLKREKKHARTLKETGQLEFGDYESGKTQMLKLETIDGRPFKLKG